jgi:hypothetical protein
MRTAPSWIVADRFGTLISGHVTDTAAASPALLPFKKGRNAAPTELLFLKPAKRMKESVEVSSFSRITLMCVIEQPSNGHLG